MQAYSSISAVQDGSVNISHAQKKQRMNCLTMITSSMAFLLCCSMKAVYVTHQDTVHACIAMALCNLVFFWGLHQERRRRVVLRAVGQQERDLSRGGGQGNSKLTFADCLPEAETGAPVQELLARLLRPALATDLAQHKTTARRANE